MKSIEEENLNPLFESGPIKWICRYPSTWKPSLLKKEKSSSYLLFYVAYFYQQKVAIPLNARKASKYKQRGLYYN